MTADILIILAGLVALALLVLFVRYGRNVEAKRKAAEWHEQGFDLLDRYNEECFFGIAHDPAYDARMRAIQHRRNVWKMTEKTGRPDL